MIFNRNVFLSVLALIFTFVFTSCQDDDSNGQTDNLEQVGLLGTWKLESRTINGITDLSVPCCDFLNLVSDDNLNDMKGDFTAESTGSETNGVFELKNSNQTIEFNFNDQILAYDISISNDMITFNYSEDGNSIEEDWRKQNE